MRVGPGKMSICAKMKQGRRVVHGPFGGHIGDNEKECRDADAIQVL